MGFRNPLTSLSGDQITPGTITGSTLQTAATGKRVVISSATSGRADFYSGDPREVKPGTVNSGVLGIPGVPLNDTSYLTVSSPIIDTSGASDEAVITVAGGSPSGAIHPVIRMTAFNVVVESTNFTTTNVLQLGNEQWTDLPLNPGIPWAAYDVNTVPQYRKDAAGLVSMCGLVKNGYFGTVIGTLPYGYWPVKPVYATVMVAIDGVEKNIRVTVFPDGTITCGNGTGSVIFYLSLSQLTFSTL
jgi:hypothetical protein